MVTDIAAHLHSMNSHWPYTFRTQLYFGVINHSLMHLIKAQRVVLTLTQVYKSLYLVHGTCLIVDLF